MHDTGLSSDNRVSQIRDSVCFGAFETQPQVSNNNDDDDDDNYVYEF